MATARSAPSVTLTNDDPELVAIAGAAGIPAKIGPHNEIAVGDRSFPMQIVDPNHRGVGSILEELSRVPDGSIRLVAGKTNPDLRSALESRGVSWLDSRGAAHLVAYGVDRRYGRPDRLDAVVSSSRPGLRLGHATVRAAQLVLDSGSERWGVTDLAGRAGISKGSASSLLRGLTNLGFFNSVGMAPSLHYELADRPGLARWFLDEPATRARRERSRVFVYARDPQDLAKRIARSPVASRLAISGGLGALVSGSGMTAVPIALVWVDPAVDLNDAIDGLDGDPLSAAPNVLLQRDIGRVAMLDRRIIDKIPVAPPSRIWVDLHDEPRGEDQAVIYRETNCAF